MEFMILESRALEPIIRILQNVRTLAYNMFGSYDSFLYTLVRTILNNPYMFVSLCLVLVGFVIGILKRLISI